MNTDQTLQQAIACHQAGQLQEAGELYLSILQTDPNHAEANHKMGILALQMEQPAAALPYFMAALEAEPSRGQYWVGYIEALFQAGQPEEARQVLALARQQGLEGSEAEALAARIENGTQLEESDRQQTTNPRIEEINAIVSLFNEGRLTEAAALAQEMTERFPRHAFGWKALGAVFKQLGRNGDALAPMQKAAAMSPDDVEVHYNLGAVLQVLGRLDEAETSYRRALQINPDYAEAHSNLGSTLHELGRLSEAEASIRRSLALKPDNPIALNNLGNTLQTLDRPEEAEASYRRAIKIKPDYAEAHCNLGFTLKQLKKTEEAEASYRQTLRINPAYVQAHYNLANTLKELNRLDEAEASYRQAIKIKPDFAEAYSNLGAILKDMNRPTESEDCLRRALEINPTYVKAIGNLGATLQVQNRLAEAEACYRQALKIQPDNPEANNNLGTILQEQNRFHEAEACYRMTLQAKPDFVEALGNLGVVLHELNRLVEAQACYRKALEINPEFGPAHLNLAAALAYLSDFDEVVAQSNAGMHLKDLNAGDWERHLYVYSYHPDLTAGEIYAEFVRWGDRFPDPVTDFGAHDRTPGRRLKIGYVSPDFRRHTSRFFFWPLFANHDHAAVELYAYSNVGVEDEFTAGFKTLFDHWRPIRGMADDEVARMVREDGIDILVDACSHMRDDRLGVFTLKPAPIQVTWLGAAWTTGLKAVDYALIDPYMAPEGTLTRETIVRLPHSFVAFRPPEVTADIAPPPCLKNGHITFGYSGRTERLNHHTFRVWGEILRQNPAARLILDFGTFADPLAQAHYREFMVRCGMNPDQVILRNSANIFAGLNDFDILLDSFPHSGGTMLFDALWMGVPVLTLASRPPVGRIGTSLMTNLGLPEWVAESEAEYIAKAATLSRDFGALTELRAGMRGRMQRSPLMDGPGFARGVEAAYRTMFEKWAGDNPALSGEFKTRQKENLPSHEVDTLVSLFTAKRYAEAAARAQEMTARFPQHALGWKILGMAYKLMGRTADALHPSQMAAALSPDDAQVHCNLGVTLHDLGRPGESEMSLRRALQIKPDYANAHFNLGATLQDLGRFEEAEASYRHALHISPENATAYSNLGVTLQHLGRLDEAEASLRQALKVSPDFAEAWNNLGNTLKGLGKLGEAETSYRKALEINPDFAGVHCNLGIALQDMNRLDEAQDSYRRALQINPENVIAHNNLGIVLQALGHLDEARASYRRALQVDPGYADAHLNLGALFMAQGELNEAEASYRKALEINPDFAQAHSNLGVALQDMGRLDEAEACYRKALEINPEFSDAHGNLLFALNYHPDKSAKEIFLAYQEYDASRGAPLRSTWRAHNNDRNPERRLRIGYVSPDFKHHSCRYFLEPLLAHHDKTRVEVFAYAELVKDDYMTARYKNYVEHWVPTRGMNDETLAERIRSDGIDILIELAGHTAGNRLLAFARKPAPVSLSWLGYGYTTGLGAIDYYLTDEASAPIGSEELFAEHPWRIDTPAYAYRPDDGMGEINGLPALQRGHITFGTLTRSIRVNHRTIRVWSAILKAVPGSRLVMDSFSFRTQAMQAQLVTQFSRHGIARERLEIGFHSPPWDVLRGIDIGLDCFPHNSGTTLFETLYMGVPYITLAGRPSVGRLGSSILQGAGHPEWIAASEDEYVAKAVELAGDTARLSGIRSTLRDQIEHGPLRDEAGFARKVEQAYRKMWENWCKTGN